MKMGKLEQKRILRNRDDKNKLTKIRPSSFIINKQAPTVREWIDYYEWAGYERKNGIDGFESIEQIDQILTVLYTKDKEEKPPLKNYSLPLIAFFGSRLENDKGLTPKESINVANKFENNLKNKIKKEIQEDNTLVLLEEVGQINIDQINDPIKIFIQALEEVTKKEYHIISNAQGQFIKEYK